ncbi:shootin-1 isoform X2 [Mixophyes fleayi]|uniref:shootin-1 isoform X2 n=1 Tax=Mixophyes fleayi TaxID=3061075 RepID=UPI003F4E4301
MIRSEEVEDRELEIIAGLKDQAIEQFEELKTENEKNKDEYDKVRQQRDEAVRKLEEFSKISHMVIEEVSFMQNNLEIEKTCRESAEALALKLNKENKNLKRISMLYMAKLGPDIITEEISLTGDDLSCEVDGGICTSLGCQQRFKELQEQILSVEEKKKTATIELEDLRSKLVDLIEEVNITKKENVMLSKEVFDQRKLLDKYNRVSVLAVEEYEDLQTSLEMEKDLRQKAESLAKEMYIEQNQLKRQSCLLLQSCAPDQQLLKALEDNAKLTHLLEEDRIQHQLKMKEVEEQLEEDKLLKEVQSLKKRLDILEEEKKDLETKLQSSESTVKDLKYSVEELQKRVHQAENPPPPPPPPPPPLPPPPPPNPIRSLMSMIRKKPSVTVSAVNKETDSQIVSGDVGDLKKQAVEEMMDRIKKGVHLRPVQQTVRVKTQIGQQQPQAPPVVTAPSAGSAEKAKPANVKPSNSAVQELRGILDSLNSSGGRKRVGALSAASTETELERILRRRKVTTEQDASVGTLTALESKSMPVLGSATNSPLSKKPKEAELRSGCRDAPGAEKLNLKVASHSAETLVYAGDVKKDGIAPQPPGDGNTDPAKNIESTDKRGKDTDSSNC